MSSGAVQQIKDKLSIIDVITPYVELHKAGKNFKGKSPFTVEKTPSFYVSPDRGMYYCFSSSQGGDMFTFIQKMEGVDFKGALKILADKAGVELVPEDPKKRSERDGLYQVLEEATRFFEKELAKSKDATVYLEDRAVTKDTIEKWRIGYAPNDWRQLREHLLAKGYDDQTLIKAGLTKQTDPSKQPFDVFRDRIMFPIMDPSGRVIAFSGRILSKDTEAPKYVNSPETELFNKSAALFGYDKAKHGIHKLDFSLVVEGQFDVVLSHQAGYNNTVAVSGTALTTEHMSLLQRLSNRVVLALDADKAGVAAVKRAASLALGRGIDLKVARIHGGKDPADLVREDPKLLRKDIGAARHVIEFLLEVLKEECKDERMYKLRARDEILPYVMMIDSHIERDHFAGVIAEATGTSVDAISSEINRLAAKEKVTSPTRAAADTKPVLVEDKPSKRKDNLVEFLTVIEELLPATDAAILSERFNELVGKTPGEIRKDLQPEVLSRLTFTMERYLSEVNPKQIREDWEDKLEQLAVILSKEELSVLKHSLHNAEREGDDSAAAGHISAIDKLRQKLGI